MPPRLWEERNMQRYARSFTILLLLLGACHKSAPSGASAHAAHPAATSQPVSVRVVATDEAKAIVAATDRLPSDVELDAGRHPAELLSFYGIRAGMQVAELAAGGGYTAELLARAVGPTGRVYGQNSAFILERFAEGPWSERLKRPAMASAIRVDREFDAPLPEEAKDLDAVFLLLFYHDTVWLKTDRARMNQAIFEALKPGGIYAIIDHSATAGTGVADAETLHRIAEDTVIAEVTAAGFRLAETADFMRNPSDARDWNASPRSAAERRGTSDRFVLKFVKP